MVFARRRTAMPRKQYKPEEIVAKLRQVDVLTSQGQSTADAIRSIGISEVTYYRWRQEFGGLKSDQVKRLKHLETENTPLRRAISDLALDKLILQEAVRGNYRAPQGACPACVRPQLADRGPAAWTSSISFLLSCGSRGTGKLGACMGGGSRTFAKPLGNRERKSTALFPPNEKCGFLRWFESAGFLCKPDAVPARRLRWDVTTGIFETDS